MIGHQQENNQLSLVNATSVQTILSCDWSMFTWH